MASFETGSFSLGEQMLRLKSMYVFFLNQGIDISQPQPTTELYDLCRFYQQETGETPMHLTLLSRPTSGEQAAFTAPENRAFRPGYDVQINRHANYNPVPHHAHEYFEILVTVKGDCAVWFGDTRVDQSTGDLLLIPPYVVHTNRVFTDDCVMYSMSVRQSTVRQRFPQLFLEDHLLSRFFGRAYDHAGEPRALCFHTGDYFLGENSLADLWEEYQREESLSSEFATLHTARFLLTLLRDFAADAEELRFVSSRPQVETLITQYIREHPDSVSLPELSRKFSYSERHITRLIRQNTGMSYSQLVRKIRMEAIGELVSDPALPIEQIIRDCGVSSPSYFYKTFRAYFGMTPREYRERTVAGRRAG